MRRPAARVGDHVLQDDPHCHAPIHPPAPLPTPTPHEPQPMMINRGSPNVSINGRRAARVSDTTVSCMLSGCVPAGPGTISRGSASVFINRLPAARVGDRTAHTSCVAPIPAPVGRVIAPGARSVMIGD